MTPHVLVGDDELRAATALMPETLSQYLSSTGWAPEQRLERATLWTRREDDGDFQVLVPGDRALRDYASRVSDFLTTVAAVEERPIRLLLDDLESGGADTLSFRLLPSGPSGTIPLFNAVDALAGVRELVVSSAYALTIDQPMLVQGRRPESALDFARTVRLGTPRAGSWAIAAQLAVPRVDADAAPPLARQVTLQMHRAVRACFAASGEALREFDLELFLRRTSEGVSANVCDALAKLGRDGVPYDVRFNWARDLPSSVPARSFRFSTRRIEALHTAAEQLKVAVPDGEVTVEGQVSKLRRDIGEGGQATVRGPIHTVYGSSERSVRVMLPDALYQRLVDAHGRRQHVRVTGTAVRGRIERVSRVEVLGGATEA
ncbi:hypothetical protein [Actinoplanes auranticolor]|uniref:Uncharacterized protein n=1 Tax=Actinoplanes auranticolor TaxID=47988 RepID=A0A919W4U1_9ACTN|nr:hypothetical protein [Actinoplanes auranticolor]GIM79768.1 hypothetical protein Aau02nite_87360 [Actinoplanes auranticolor]